jgi:hypothetical protein
MAHGDNGPGSPSMLEKWRPSLATNKTAGIAIVGVSCGVLAFVYSTVLAAFITATWDTIPKTFILPALDSSGLLDSHPWVAGLYVVAVPTLYGTIVGVTQRFLGSPGDMPETIGSFNSQGWVNYNQVRPARH